MEFNYKKYFPKELDLELLNLLRQIEKIDVKRKYVLDKEEEKITKTLINIAKIQSTINSNAIEGINVKDERIEKLLNEKTKPNNKTEKEFLGYKTALDYIYNLDCKSQYLTVDFIKYIHYLLYSNLDETKNIGGKFKVRNNYINSRFVDEFGNVKEKTIFIPLDYKKVEQALEDICLEFEISNLDETKNIGGKFKVRNNYINSRFVDEFGNVKEKTIFIPLDYKKVEQALEDICLEFEMNVNENTEYTLLYIPVFIFHFLCIHPFEDGNGRLSRLLTTFLLLRYDFDGVRYISFEKEIAMYKNYYYESLKNSNKTFKNTEFPREFVIFFLKILKTTYDELDNRMEILIDIKNKKDKLEIIKKIIQFKKTFNLKIIQNEVPSFSKKEIEKHLEILIKNNEIKKIGVRKLCYYINLKI